MADILAMNVAVDAAITSKTTSNSISPADVGNAIKATNNELRPYKVYTAILNQSAGLAPVATIVENSLGVVPVFIYGDSGDITIDAGAGAFPVAKTVAFASIGGSASVGTWFIDLLTTNGDLMNLRMRDQTVINFVDGLINAFIEIRVYN